MLSRTFSFLFGRWLDRLPEDERIQWLMAKLAQSVDPGRRSSLYFGDLATTLEAGRLRKLYGDEIAKTLDPGEQFLMPAFDAGFGREEDRFSTYQKDRVAFEIKRGDKVLDIGSGSYPFPYATHLADLYEGDTTHRVEPLLKQGLPFEKCDIERLPYRSREFDFVYCSHVLEHVKDPGRACEEIMRVGRRGYIETPTRLSDIMLNFTRLKDHHRWHVNLLKNSLIFMEWSPHERRDTGVNEFYCMLHSKYKNPFQTLVREQRDLFVNMLLWEEKFYYYVFDCQGTLLTANAESGKRV